jgi:gliding motility-associated-like protein
MKRIGMLIVLVCFMPAIYGQPCTATGQTPTSAILVCGSGIYLQHPVSPCGSITIPTPCTDNITHQDKSATWFRFACYSSGNIGFIITPNEPSDNYDWQLFDMTNRNPSDVLWDNRLFLACNWSIGQGDTGASIDGTSLMVYSGPGEPAFSSMPDLQQGHEYLLLVSHFTSSINGFQLQFNDGSASITDPEETKLQYARTNCDGSQLIVRLNRKVLCSSLSNDGSEFSLSPSGIITSAIPFSCNNGDFDSLTLNLASPLINGNYVLSIRDGSDGNTLMDRCSRFIASGNSIPLVASPPQPTPLDSITTPDCKSSELQIVFRRPIRCSSIAGDGSDFSITGPQAIHIISAQTNCSTNTLTSIIKLKLASPIMTGGIYQVILKTGTDGNTLIDECGLITAAGSTAVFISKDAVAADFSYTIKNGCKKDTLQFSHPGGMGITEWSWKFDANNSSMLQNPVMIFSSNGSHTIQLIVSNGACKDTSRKTVLLNNEVIAAFEISSTLCPGDSAFIVNKSTGAVSNWNWNFGNGNTSTAKDPGAIHFNANGAEMIYTIRLTVTGNSGCRDSTSRPIRVLGNCLLSVPNAFSPNHDGLNDYFYPLNAYDADNLDFKVYNRFGQLVFAAKNGQKKWDGTVNGLPQPAGIYVWMLRYSNRNTGKKYLLKGTVMLVR